MEFLSFSWYNKPKAVIILLKAYYKVKCFYITKEPDHFHGFDIGIFDSIEKAQQIVEKLKDKPGFQAYSIRTIKLKRPKKSRSSERFFYPLRKNPRKTFLPFAGFC